jgi:hypothetical protein
MLRPEYLAEKLTPYPLPTKDGGVLRTIGDARAYMLALPKKREQRAHWQHACRLLLQETGVAAFPGQPVTPVKLKWPCLPRRRWGLTSRHCSSVSRRRSRVAA